MAERKLRYSDETISGYRALARGNCSSGIGILVINPEGKILTGEETGEKSITQKKPGERGVIAETRLLKERPIENLRRGVREELHGELTPEHATAYSLVLDSENPAFYPEAIYVNGDPNVRGDLALVVYDDQRLRGQYGFFGELTKLSWMTPREILQLPNIRDLTRQFLQFFGTNLQSVIEQYVEKYNSNPEKRVPLFRTPHHVTGIRSGIIFEDVHK